MDDGVKLPAKHVDPEQFGSLMKEAQEGKVEFAYMGSTVVKQGNDFIYMVTSVRDGIMGHGTEPRTWGFVMTEKEARDAVAENAGDMCEDGYYKYIVIEKLGSGIFCTQCEVVDWFEWSPDGKWVHIETPEWSKHLFNWAL